MGQGHWAERDGEKERDEQGGRDPATSTSERTGPADLHTVA